MPLFEDLPWRMLDPTHRARFLIADRAGSFTLVDAPKPNDKVVGVELHHLRADGLWCGSYIAPTGADTTAARVTPTGHTIVSRNPLTITPGIICPICGIVSTVTAGVWTDN